MKAEAIKDLELKITYTSFTSHAICDIGQYRQDVQSITEPDIKKKCIFRYAAETWQKYQTP